VTQNNAPDFVPANSSIVLNATCISSAAPDNQTLIGVTDVQRDDAYQQWLQGM
jgi:hypothetical protein